MVKMIHALTGTVMYVEDARRAEYLAAGHRLAEADAPAETAAAVQVAEAAVTAAPAAKQTAAKPAAKSAAKPAAKAKSTPAKKR